MTLTKDISAKFAVAFVAVAMIFSAFAAPAQAQTTEDLQQMINDLLSQVAALQTQLGGGETTGGSMAAGVCPYTWTRDLSQGSEGADVMKLQQFLNANADTRVAATGAGSAGMETMYYGPATAAAVSKMQVAYRADILTPAGLVNPTGYFGPSSRAKANMLCVAAPVDGGEEGEEGSEEEEEEEEESTGSMSLSGEGILTTLEVDDEEDEVQEGAEDVVVASLTLEAEDGDLELSRVTMSLEDAGGDVNDENDPWDVFEEVSLWVDGDKVASFDAADEDEYLDEDGPVFTFRFSNLDLFLPEDDEVEVLVAVSVMNSVDGAATPGDTSADWEIGPVSVRVFDADGVADTINSGLELGDVELFDIVEEGFDDGADLESSSSNPDAATLKVDQDTDESDEYLTHVFEIEVDEDSSDLTVEDVWYAVTITNGGSDITGGQEDVLNEITMTIDGVTVDGEAILTADLNGGVDEEDTPIDAAATVANQTTVHYLFEFDGDVELEADETYDVEVMMTFEGQDGNFVNGVTVQGTAPGAIWEVEGLESDNTLTGSDSSEIHTLADVVPIISGFTTDSDESDDQRTGTISFEFNIEADDEDIIGFDITDIITTLTSTAGVPVVPTSGLSRVSGDATDVGGGQWTINDGDDATFALDFSYAATAAAGENGTYRVTVDSISGVEIDEVESINLAD